MEEYIINNKKVAVDLFSEIRDVNDAYFIGYLLADGNYGAATHKRKHRISVSSTDHYIIEWFKDKYQPSTKLVLKEPNSNLKDGIIGRKQFKLLTFSSLFSDYLNSFGVMSLKPEREIKNIPSNYFKPLLLGLFDADGSISYGYRADRDRLWANFRITHSSIKLLTEVKDYLNKLGIYVSLKPKGIEKCFVLTVSNVESVKSLYNIIYTQLPEVFNFTKQSKYSEFLNVFEDEIDEEFVCPY